MRSLCSHISMSEDWHYRPLTSFREMLEFYKIEHGHLNPNDIFHTSIFVHFFFFFEIDKVQRRRSQHARTLTHMNTRTQTLPL
jgi:hypothetical protein